MGRVTWGEEAPATEEAFEAALDVYRRRRKFNVRLAILGIVIIVVGFAFAVDWIFTETPNMEYEAISTLSLRDDHLNRTINLKAGTYDLWQLEDPWPSPLVTVRDAQGEVLLASRVEVGSDTMPSEGDTYYLLGTFRHSGGKVEVSADNTTDVIVTPPIDLGHAWIGCYTGIIAAVIGCVTIAIGFLRHRAVRKPVEPHVRPSTLAGEYHIPATAGPPKAPPAPPPPSYGGAHTQKPERPGVPVSQVGGGPPPPPPPPSFGSGGPSKDR